MFHWEKEIALHAMQGNRASSHGEREFSWVFSSCGRHLGYILELRPGCPFFFFFFLFVVNFVIHWNKTAMGLLELRQEPGVYSRVTAGMSIRNSSLFIEVRNLSRYGGQVRNVN